MFSKPLLYSFIGFCLLFSTLFAQSSDNEAKFKPYFEEAYRLYPSIPKGLLESVAYTNTRMTHLKPGPKITTEEGCAADAMPRYWGVMGLTEGGSALFKESLKKVQELSGYSMDQIKNDPKINILAYAKAYSILQSETRDANTSVENDKPILTALSELPDGKSNFEEYVTDQNFYAVLVGIDTDMGKRDGDNKRQMFDYEKIFGKNKFSVLSASAVTMTERSITSNTGVVYGDGETQNRDLNSNGACSPNGADFAGAIWTPANSRNYGSRNGADVEFIAIHTVVGSYSSCIATFRDPNLSPRRSAHYVIRSFDGQVTQMVCESNNAWHAKSINSQAIGIEHEGFISEGPLWYTNALYESSAKLVKDICKRHGINPLQMYSGPGTEGLLHLGNECRKIKGHQHIPGNNHVDPGPHWDWDRYFRMVNGNAPMVEITDSEGELVDDGGKNGNYPNQAYQAWLIKPKKATSITLTFKELEIEGTANNPYDFLMIYEGKNRNGKLIGRYTGSQLPSKPIQIRGGYCYVEFRSDCQESKKGWWIKYSSDGEKKDCSAIEDVNISGLYPMGTVLSWQAAKPAPKYFVRVKLNNESKWEQYSTTQSSLRLTGLASNTLYQWQVMGLCGDDTSAVAGSEFTTPAVSRGGEVVETYTTAANKGDFLDSGAEMAPYGDLEEYIYKIIPADGGRVKMKFSSMDTESNADYLYFYDGESVNAPLIGKYSGSALPPDIVSSGNGLTIKFKSDKNKRFKGWKASWTTLGGNGSNNTGVDEGTSSQGSSSNAGSTSGGSGNSNSGNSNAGNNSGNSGNSNAGNNSGNSGNSNAGNNSGNSGNSNSGNNSGNSGNSNAGNNSGNSGAGTTSIPDAFLPELLYLNNAPITKPIMPSIFKLGLVHIAFEEPATSEGYYQLLEKSPKGWEANSAKGFLLEDFNDATNDWTQGAGKWKMMKDRMVQTDLAVGNANLYHALTQNAENTYLYTWEVRMNGAQDNRRSGFHFFANDATKENRGQSYFIWARCTNSGDRVEIYEVGSNDQFVMQAKADFDFKSDKAYEFKTLYNPKTGDISVYINNVHVVSWKDETPITSGKFISLRAGTCLTEFDNVRVWKGRGKNVELQAGADKDVRYESVGENPAIRVHSLARIAANWSKEAVASAKIKFPDDKGGNTGSGTGNTGGNTNTGGSSSGNTNTGGGNSGSTGNQSDGAYTDDFSFDSGSLSSTTLQRFGLVSESNGVYWTANGLAGYAYDDFGQSKLDGQWQVVSGQWKLNKGLVENADTAATNSNLSLNLSQSETPYLYHFRANMKTAGKNRRFGFHLFADNPSNPNRGNSYMVWFRCNDGKADMIEIFETLNGELKPISTAVAETDIKTGEWADIKIVYNPKDGKLSVWVNNVHELTYTDPSPLKQGSAISFRTAGSHTQIDNLRVYRGHSGKMKVTVGKAPNDAARYSCRPGIQIHQWDRSTGNLWGGFKTTAFSIAVPK